MSRPTPPRFTLADLEAANDAWGCNCGPGALAAICGLTLDDVRPHLGEVWPGYTNPTTMLAALRSLWRAGRIIAIRHLMRPDGSLPWPRWGLCRIQWEGPWTAQGANPRWAYTHTHWVGVSQGKGSRNQHLTDIFDVNAVGGGGPLEDGWGPLEWWSSDLVPLLTKDIKRATGGWYVTHAIEVAR